jgi:hypothetical protein
LVETGLNLDCSYHENSEPNQWQAGYPDKRQRNEK